jgi:hypothetical protein
MTEIERLTRERDIWKAELVHLNKKHTERERQEKEANLMQIDYDGPKFDNSVLCAYEVAKARIEILKSLNS